MGRGRDRGRGRGRGRRLRVGSNMYSLRVGSFVYFCHVNPPIFSFVLSYEFTGRDAVVIILYKDRIQSTSKG